MNIWSLLGISVALVAAFCIIMTEVFQDKSYYETYKWYACAFLLASGIIMWFAGMKISARGKNPPGQATNERPDHENVPDEDGAQADTAPFFLFSPQYWGAVLVTFGIAVIFIVPMPSGPKVAASSAPAPPRQTNADPTLLPETNQMLALGPSPDPAPFPEVKLQGIIFKPGNPSVVIKGKAFFAGDYIEDAKLVAIERSYITLESQGQRKIVLMDY